MNNIANKKDIFYIVVLILTFITVVVGATFAIYTFIESPQEEGASAVYTGTLSIECLFGEIINVNLLYPTEKPTIETTKNVYKNKIKVTNTGSLDSKLSISIEISTNEFSNKTLKYSLYDSEEKELVEGYIEEGYKYIDGILNAVLVEEIDLKNNKTEEFTLLIWIAENGENQNKEMKKSLYGRIKVEAIQAEAFKK